MPETPTRIHLCGRLVVELDGQRREGDLPGRQGRLLFAYLVLNRHRPVRREELVDALWADDRPPSSGDALLRPPLSRLRKALGPDRIRGREEIATVLPDDAWIDWEEAAAAVPRARTAAAAGNWATAAREAETAVAIAQGGLLPGLEADWSKARRRELGDRLVEALEAQAAAALALGDVAGSERVARGAVEAAPFRESARAALMEALRAHGNVAEALRAYEDLRVVLRDELGATPGPRVIALHEALLRADDEPPPRAPPPRRPASSPSASCASSFEARLADPERRARVLAGAAAPAAAVFEPAETGPAGGGDATFAMLHGLFWLALNLSAEEPLVLAVDDLHWCDRPSLRWIAYLAQRLEGLPILLAATLRTGDPSGDPTLLAEIAQGPLTASLRPQPLSDAAVFRLVRERLGESADDAFCTACATGVLALTASERRIAELAARGEDDRDIAQALFVTPHEVDVHLRDVFRKLGVGSRAELAAALT